MKQKREQLSKSYMTQAGNACADHIFSLPEYKEASSVCIYIAFQNEMPTFPIIEQSYQLSKKVAAPKVTGKNMEFYYFETLESLVPGVWGIPEPLKNPLPIDENSLIIMPGVAFDKQKNRVGYGGGYYDRYLKEYPKMKTIAISYDFQVLEQIPFEEFDQIPDIIVTDKTIIR